MSSNSCVIKYFDFTKKSTDLRVRHTNVQGHYELYFLSEKQILLLLFTTNVIKIVHIK